MIAPDPDHLRRDKGFAGLQMIRGSERIDGAQGADASVVIVELALKTAGPGEGTGENFTVGLGGSSIQREDEGRILKLARTHPKFRIQHFYARRKFFRDRKSVV